MLKRKRVMTKLFETMCAHIKCRKKELFWFGQLSCYLTDNVLKAILVVSQYETLSPIYWFLVLKLEHWKHQKFSEG